MSRSAKIAGVAMAGGILMATAIAVDDREPIAPMPSPAELAPHDRLRDELARCRTLTMPDAGCEAAWEEHRRRFLGREDDRP
ncbi:putative entry exclusion protein TrbK-alt [Brevundimonas diminuta]|uniref:putative entry exclusion protein TrbK-alt n=1 Tax=Brevundimonas diminuta TaxID=293 RepID=UPI0030F61C1F